VTKSSQVSLSLEKLHKILPLIIFIHVGNWAKGSIFYRLLHLHLESNRIYSEKTPNRKDSK